MLKDMMLFMQDSYPSDSPVGAIKKIAEDEVRKLRTMEFATVIAINNSKKNYTCDVRLKNGDHDLSDVPVITSHIGLIHFPNIGDMVLVGYVYGDADSPVIIGCVHSSDQQTPEFNDTEFLYVPEDNSGKSGSRRLYVELSKSKITLTDDDLSIDLGGGNTTIKVDFKNGNVTIDTKGDTAISASGNMKISAQNITIDSGGSLSLKGKSGVEVKSDASAKVSASGQLNLEGSIVNIN
jgi:hypothetical protein